MLENQFIQFRDAIDHMSKEVPIPMVHGKENRIYIADKKRLDYYYEIDIVSPSGEMIVEKCASGYLTSNIQVSIVDLSALAPYDCFRLKSTITSDKDETTTTYSNLLCRVEENAEMSTMKYLCYESALGFPFLSGDYLSQVLPIIILAPQYKQEDKIYTKRSGEQVVLFSSVTKEYEGETDYIPMEWHEKIMLALTCDEVYINGKRVTKSGNYEIDHDNCTYSDCGIKLMRATFKVTANVTQRNSNY